MEARIALASVVVFGGVLAAGMLVSRADGGETPSVQSADFGPAAVVAQAPQDSAGSQSFTSSPAQGSGGGSPIRWDDDDWDDDDHYDDDGDDRYERDHDDHDDDDRYERDEWDDDD